MLLNECGGAMKNLKILFIISLVAIMISFLGCAANTYVTSEPRGASISVNDNYKGETPIRVNVQDEIGIGSIYIFKADLDGYKSDTKVFKEEGLQDPNAAIPKKIHFILKPIQPSVSKHYQRVNKREQKEEFVTHIQPQANNISISGQRWAVIIGISEYNDTRIPQLRYASNDANAFYNWSISNMGGKYAPFRVKLLLNKDASGHNIKDALFVWLSQALEEDVVTIYFAGHGSPQSPDNPKNLFLLPYDVNYDNIASTGFPMWDIETALKRFIKAKKVIVIADACHAGGVGQSFDIARRANRGIKINPISSGLQTLSEIGDGICVISASDDKQFSQESYKWGGGHGVFTHFLLKGLKGEADYNHDSCVTLGELIPFLSEQVRRETKNSQSPTVAGKFDPALAIAR